MTRVSGGRCWQRYRLPVFLVIGLLVPTPVVPSSTGNSCNQPFNHAEVVAALADIEASIDPCGESHEISSLLTAFRACAESGYTVCIDRQAERNSTDAAPAENGRHVYITWNPDLRTELEPGCHSDPARIVRRDPTASLLHEVAHIVQDCAGLDPNAHEFEAVRIENIYRRSRNLCQRTVYGSHPLPRSMLVDCEPGRCLCTTGDRPLMADVHRPQSLPQSDVIPGDNALGSVRAATQTE